MNSELQGDENLQALLGQWKLSDKLPPRFQEEVWLRIARQETSKPLGFWAGLSSSLNRVFARPLAASAYLSVLLIAGFAGGYWQARSDTAHSSSQLRERYLNMLQAYEGLHVASASVRNPG